MQSRIVHSSLPIVNFLLTPPKHNQMVIPYIYKPVLSPCLSIQNKMHLVVLFSLSKKINLHFSNTKFEVGLRTFVQILCMKF